MLVAPERVTILGASQGPSWSAICRIFEKRKQTQNEKLCNVRKTFDQFDLISGLHSFLAQENKIYENILPPLNLLNLNDKRKLINDLAKLGFNFKESKAA